MAAFTSFCDLLCVLNAAEKALAALVVIVVDVVCLYVHAVLTVLFVIHISVALNILNIPVPRVLFQRYLLASSPSMIYATTSAKVLNVFIISTFQPLGLPF